VGQLADVEIKRTMHQFEEQVQARKKAVDQQSQQGMTASQNSNPDNPEAVVPAPTPTAVTPTTNPSTRARGASRDTLRDLG
jgi:hypothetical protein